MPALRLASFDGIYPRIDPRLLPEAAAQTAQNVILHSGKLVPLRDVTTVEACGSSQKSLFLWRNRQKSPVTETWRTWAEVVSVIGSPVADDAYSRYFYTGAADGKLKVYGSFAAESAGEERDVEMPIPDISGISIEGAYRADPSTWLLRRYINSTDTPNWAGGLVCTYVSHEWTDTGVKVKFRIPSYETDNASSFYMNPRVFLKIGDDQFPATWGGTAPASDMFSCGEMLAQSDDDGKFGDLTVIGWTYDNRVAMTPTKTYAFPGYDIEIEFKMNYLQAFDLYYYYLFTYVDDTGVEGPPSDLSEFITRSPGQAVEITDIPVSSEDNIEKKRIYRSAAGGTEDEFLFLTEMDNATTSWTDAVEDAELSEALGVYGNPPDDLEGLTLLACGSAAAFSGKDVYLTRPYHLHVWPSDYNFVAGYDIVALAAMGNDLYVLTKGLPEVISGSNPEFMSVRQLDEPQSCVSARSVAKVAGRIVYASPDGLVAISNGGLQLLTGRHYSREEWQALSPENMIGAAQDQKYYGFTATGGIVVDFADGLRITTHDEVVLGAVADLEDDQLYVIQGTNIVTWDTGDNKTLAWKSRKVQFGQNTVFSVARIISDDYDDGDEEVTLKLYGAGELLATVYTRSDEPFRLPLMRSEKVWEFQVEADIPIKEIQLASSMEGLR